MISAVTITVARQTINGIASRRIIWSFSSANFIVFRIICKEIVPDGR